jgi:hypothetical protein
MAIPELKIQPLPIMQISEITYWWERMVTFAHHSDHAVVLAGSARARDYQMITSLLKPPVSFVLRLTRGRTVDRQARDAFS